MMNAPSYIEHLSGKLSRDERGTLKLMAMLYIEDICTWEPWPSGNSKQTIILKCLSQGNVHASQCNRPVIEDSYEIRDEVSCTVHVIAYSKLTNGD